MMMETSVYAREFLYSQELYSSGRLGELTVYRGFHLQNLDGYPQYWIGYPPMHYVTHALSPALALTGSTVDRVTAFGSGRLTPDRAGGYHNPFPVEVGLFALRDHPLVPQVTMSFFQTARPYVEGFDVLGDRAGLEWPVDNDGPLTLHELQDLDPALGTTGLRGRRSTTNLVEPPTFAERLPPELARFTAPFEIPARGEWPARRAAGLARRLAPAPGPRIRVIDRRRASVGDRRPHRCGLDRTRDLCPRVRDARRGVRQRPRLLRSGGPHGRDRRDGRQRRRRLSAGRSGRSGRSGRLATEAGCGPSPVAAPGSCPHRSG